jgi:hypothetical protein
MIATLPTNRNLFKKTTGADTKFMTMWESIAHFQED